MRGSFGYARRHFNPPHHPPHEPARRDCRLDGLRHHHGVRRPVHRPHPSGPDPQDQPVLPVAAHAPRIRRLRRQHRLQLQAGRRRAGAHRHGRRRLRALPGALPALGHRLELPGEATDSYTAQCFIVTDLHNNQLAGFHPGAMGLSAQIPVAQAGAIACGLVGPDAKDAMQLHTQQMADALRALHPGPGPEHPAVQRARSCWS